MRRIPIRMKLVGALAVPLIALTVVTVLEVVTSAQDAARVREQRDLAEASIGPASLLSVLENERNAAAVYLLDAQDAFALPVEDNAEARGITDGAVSALRSRVTELGGAVEAAYLPAIDRMDELGALREAIDTDPNPRGLPNIGPVSTYFDQYTDLMDDLFAANKRAALAVDDPELRRGAELIDLSGRQTNLVAILVRDLLLAQVGGSAPDGVNTPGEIAPVAQALGQLRANEELIDTKATADYRQLAADLFAAEEIVRFPQAVDEALATGQVNLDDMITYSTGEDPETYGYTVFREGVSEALTDRADDLQAAADARQRWFIVLAATAIGSALLITFLVSRSITKPLRSLTRQAKDMAERRLPDAVIDILETPLGDDVQVPTVEPVVVHTRDEVADVSTALNTVQDTALDLAVEQAVLRRNIADSFVNLGRRNQNLLGRQLDFITELESNETNADTLSNLFRLDHLATRMRRNAESLLVLAGIEPPRKWAAPVRLTDVIRAALGEVEDYQRVTVRGVEPATIIGSAAADLAHLLAELIENALVFSPPDQTVDIRGRTNPHGYTLAVIDSGLGMPQTDITNANRRLAGAESFTIAPSKYLGHYVAGNLAARHNIQVTLDNSPGNGVTATIDLPPTLLTADNELAPEVTPPHGHRKLPPGARPGLVAPAAVGGRGAPPVGRSSLDLAGPPPAPTPGPAMPPSRTQSGLVKRAARDGSGSTLGAERPTGDLLAQLSRHNMNLGGRPSAPSALGGPAGPAPRSWSAPPPGPGGDPGPGGPPSLARRAPAGDPPPASTGPTGPRPGGLTGSGGAGAGVPGTPIGHGPLSPASPPAPSDGGTATSGGLTRRVRGAQLPTTQPLQLRRSSGGADSSPARPAEPAAPPSPRSPSSPYDPTGLVRPSGGNRRADDVYSFLSSFSAGVQRGLDDAEQAAADRRGEG